MFHEGNHPKFTDPPIAHFSTLHYTILTHSMHRKVHLYVIIICMDIQSLDHAGSTHVIKILQVIPLLLLCLIKQIAVTAWHE